MALHRYVNGKCYTLKILCPEISNIFLREQKRLMPYLEKKVDVERIHIGLKYMAYEQDYNVDYIKALVPGIKKIVDVYLPMDIDIKGLGGFWDTEEWPTKPVVYIAVKLSSRLKEFHGVLRDFLSDKVDTFTLAEGNNYTPHITLGTGLESKANELKMLVDNSNFSEHFTVDKFGMRLLGGETYIIR
ncbi:2'-5' RNA ligase family protein [Candidatus Woesearchaeota archaeon]|nr:2'-5' RNA ligase family protein [Candidatus Woesearchaeota archaeon]